MSCIYVYIANVHVGVPVCMCCINGGLDGHGCAKCGEGGVGVGVMCTGFIYFPFPSFLVQASILGLSGGVSGSNMGGV